MSGETRLFLGDLTRALALAGRADRSDWEQIAAMLGFGRESVAPERPAQGVVASPESSAVASVRESRLPERRPAEPVLDPRDIGELLEFDVDRGTWPGSPLPQQAPTSSGQVRGARLELQPLLAPLWERGVLIEAVGQPEAIGDIVIVAAVEAIARGEPMAKVPREQVQSLSKGCQILLDTGPGMRPFGRDARTLVSAIRDAAGAEHTHVLTFVDCPLRGVLNESYDDEPYRAPDNGAMVLAVTDLCAGGPRSAIRQAAPRDWLTVARMVRDAGSTLVVLNPYPENVWPAEVRAKAPIVFWDRTTRASDVRRARRRRR